ncbi:putative F-box domain, leucine-rich repeat domain, L domain-containing protein [Rosa chinensis]|uniref:Putative F-box domain, leucine-rich repeat domain, L domain-containing protein n=1 Tax=Rosa chinensis TaxID=74649 RepID=A0A2P6Q5X8_ROSCH|nr:uncharacterized protein LOC112166246 [Rosa chinensis]PRQ29564.1 putative F-box domain, leucine-rich repeat domain, L domain-containing protein [Rosa chinensis]
MGGKKKHKQTFRPPPPPKRVWVVKRRNWLEIPDDVTAAILTRVGAIGMLESAQKVCTKWRRICKDPLMWRQIDMRNDGTQHEMEDLENMCRHAVGRSAGKLVGITVEHFGTDDLLKYITDSSSGIRHLRLLSCEEEITTQGLAKVASKLPLLEELEITLCFNISHEALDVVGRSCPLLKSFKLNKEWCTYSDMEDWFEDDAPSQVEDDVDALAIARSMHGLHHLQLYGNKLTDDGLRKILDCCPHLESLDLRRCFNLNMGGDLEIRLEQIKKLWLPHDSTKGKGFAADSDHFCFKWTELPDDVTLSILSRVGAIDILVNAQKVCMKWRRICKDPVMWRTIDMRNRGYEVYDLGKMCRHAIDRSCGNLDDISIDHFGTNRLLKYITDSSSRIKRLRLALCKRISDQGVIEVAMKLPLLEDLEISLCRLSRKSLEVVGRSCPLLKSFKLNRRTDDDYDASIAFTKKNDEALAIARTMHGLHHLQLFGNELTNEGLKEILDGCPHLESLDLRCCENLNLKGPLGIRCSEQIKKLWLPRDSIADYDFRFTVCGYGSPRKFTVSDLIGFPRIDNDYDEYGYGNYGGWCSDDSDWYDDFTKPPLEELLGLDEEDLEFFGLGKGRRRDYLEDFYDFEDYGDYESDDEMFY